MKFMLLKKVRLLDVELRKDFNSKEKYMKKLLIGFVLMSCFSVQASNTDKECLSAYQSGLNSLVEDSEAYNNGRLDNMEFSAKVAVISTEVSSMRSLCHFIEDPSIKECVKTFKKAYKTQRDQISIISILSGNQDTVKIKRITNTFNMIGSAARGCYLE